MFAYVCLCSRSRAPVLNAQILEERTQVLFHLQQQRLIELIRSGNVEEALDFAQEYLAPQGAENVRALRVGAPLFRFQKSLPPASIISGVQDKASRRRLLALLVVGFEVCEWLS